MVVTFLSLCHKHNDSLKPLSPTTLKEIKMKHLNLLARWTIGLAAMIFAAPYTAVAADAPDAYAYCNFSRAFDCKLVKSIAAQPDWKPFADAATKKIDSTYLEVREHPSFPKAFADMVLDKVLQATSKGNKSDLTSKDFIGVVAPEFEAILISVWGGQNVEQPEVAVSLFTRFDPAEMEDFLKFVPQAFYSTRDSVGKLYKFLLGDKILYAGYIQLSGRGDYVLAISEHQNRVEQQLQYAKSGEFLKTVLQSSGPFDKIEITSGLIDKVREKAIQEIKSKGDSDPNAQNVIAILENLVSISLATEDTSESTATTLSVTMKKEEEAKNLKEMAEGLIAMVKMFASFSSDLDENAKKVIGLISQIKIEQKGQTITASLNYGTPEMQNAIKELLAKGLEELKK